MTHDPHSERALEKLVDDVRRTSVTDVDWDKVESSLLARVARAAETEASTPARAPSMASRWMLVAAALLGATTAVVAAYRHDTLSGSLAERSTAEPTLSASTELDGDKLAIGATVVASADAVVVTHRGHATWTLEPNSAAHVEAVGDVVALALDRGALSAHVVKSPRPESFVVRVERTRVAVHGTRFRVERGSDTTHISVTEGVVGVGPVGGTAAFELAAPASAIVTFDGVRTDVPPSVAVQSGSKKPSEAAAALASKERPRAPASMHEETMTGTAEIDRVESAVSRCFADLTVSRGDLRVTVSTHMSLRVGSNGKITEASFDPPLVPAVRACVDEKTRQIAFPASSDTLTVTRVLELDH